MSEQYIVDVRVYCRYQHPQSALQSAARDVETTGFSYIGIIPCTFTISDHDFREVTTT